MRPTVSNQPRIVISKVFKLAIHQFHKHHGCLKLNLIQVYDTGSRCKHTSVQGGIGNTTEMSVSMLRKKKELPLLKPQLCLFDQELE